MIHSSKFKIHQKMPPNGNLSNRKVLTQFPDNFLRNIQFMRGFPPLLRHIFQQKIYHTLIFLTSIVKIFKLKIKHQVDNFCTLLNKAVSDFLFFHILDINLPKLIHEEEEILYIGLFAQIHELIFHFIHVVYLEVDLFEACSGDFVFIQLFRQRLLVVNFLILVVDLVRVVVKLGVLFIG
jgi:hypothetical protein